MVKKGSASDYRQGKRRRMKKFRLDEIAAVDFPAQSPALAVLLKRRDAGEPVVSKNGVPGVMTSAEEGHVHLVWLEGRIGTTSWGKSDASDGGHDHPWILNPDGSITIGMAEGHEHTVDSTAVFEAIIAAEKRGANMDGLEELLSKAKEAAMPVDDKTHNETVEKLSAAESALKASQERIDLLALLASMTDAERSHLSALTDDASKRAFVSKTAAERKVEIDRAEARKSESDPVVYTTTAGVELRKSAGEFAISLAKRADEQAAEIEKLRAKGEESDLRKRAEELLPNLPGSIEVRMELLKQAERIENAELRKEALEALKAQNAEMAKALERRGTSEGIGDGGHGSGAIAELDSLAKARASERKIDYREAYEQVATERPDLAKEARIYTN